MLPTGTKAPDFRLSDKDGNLISLSDYIGKKIVLYFYPRDNTPGKYLHGLTKPDLYLFTRLVSCAMEIQELIDSLKQKNQELRTIK